MLWIKSKMSTEDLMRQSFDKTVKSPSPLNMLSRGWKWGWDFLYAPSWLGKVPLLHRSGEFGGGIFRRSNCTIWMSNLVGVINRERFSTPSWKKRGIRKRDNLSPCQLRGFVENYGPIGSLDFDTAFPNWTPQFYGFHVPTARGFGKNEGLGYRQNSSKSTSSMSYNNWS